MKIRVLLQYLILNFKLPKKMEEYSIYWQPQLTNMLAQECPFLDLGFPDFFPPTNEWHNGYCVKEFFLTEEQCEIVSLAAISQICIDVRPTPRPTGSPHGK